MFVNLGFVTIFRETENNLTLNVHMANRTNEIVKIGQNALMRKRLMMAVLLLEQIYNHATSAKRKRNRSTAIMKTNTSMVKLSLLM